MSNSREDTISEALSSNILHPASSIQIHWLGRGVRYEEALAQQEELVAARLRDRESVPDTLLLLEHAPVYTIGRTPDRSSLLDPDRLPHPHFTIHRGGQATYHGPGQLVGYPILDLSRRGRDLHRYLRGLESVVIEALTLHGVAGAERRAGLTGVWVENRKIASLGVGVRRWVSLHGFAVNVTRESLAPFAAITPCGIAGVEMTCLDDAAGHTKDSPTEVKAFAETVAQVFQQKFSTTDLSVKN